MPQWGFGMPPPGFDQLIAQKYAIQQQEANARTTEANANANLTTVRAGLLPAESAADIAKTGAETTGLNITNKFLPRTLDADIYARRATGNEANATATNTGLQSTLLKRNIMTPLASLFGDSGPPALSAGGFGGGFGL